MSTADRPGLTLPPNPDASHDVHTDETLVGPVELPDPLPAGGDPTDWPDRRAETLALFEDHVYGRMPSERAEATVAVTEVGVAFDGAATRHQLRIVLTRNGAGVELDVLVYVPTGRPAPVPAFVVSNFGGNHTITTDPAVTRSRHARRDLGAQIEPPGARTDRFPIAEILGRGYALATFYAGDADADLDDGHAHGAQRLFYEPGQTEPAPDEWGTIGAWAWACSRVLDALGARTDIDGRAVVVGGHSRLGKAALWAAACDERFLGAFSNNSGCGGAALSRRRFGETVAVINALFPHWFATNFAHYGDREDALPVDQHQLLALIAPRGVHVGSAQDDSWADPRGEFEAVAAASAVYRFLGVRGSDVTDPPAVDTGVVGPIGCHLRRGGHELTAQDWAYYLDAADAWLVRSRSTPDRALPFARRPPEG